MNLEMMLKALKRCREPIPEDHNPCDDCPYKEAYGQRKLYECIDKRSEDLEKLILWVMNVQKTLREFTGE